MARIAGTKKHSKKWGRATINGMPQFDDRRPDCEGLNRWQLSVMRAALAYSCT
jgi:hypothetical protein